MPNIAIIYYSSTGGTYQLAQAVQEGAEAAGGSTRLVRARELAPDAAIDSNPLWRAHLEQTRDVPIATPQDLEWADGFIFGTPTRFGLVSSQLKQFIDECSGSWQAGKLQDKAVGVFGGAGQVHGGQETTLVSLANVFYHWGAIIVPLGYTDASVFAAGGNPYGVSFSDPKGEAVPDDVLSAARYQGRRVTHFARLLRAGKE